MKSSRFLLWLSGLAALVIMTVMMFKVSALKPDVMALQLSYTADGFRQVLADWQEPGITLYRSHFPYDFAFMICYGIFSYLLATQTRFFAGLGDGLAAYAAWPMVVAALCDAAEDSMHIYLLASPDAITPAMVGLSATFTTIKWLHVSIFTVMVVAALRNRQEATKVKVRR